MSDNEAKKIDILDENTMMLYSTYRILLIYSIGLLGLVFLCILSFDPKFNFLHFINFKRIMGLVAFFITILCINILKRLYIIFCQISHNITQENKCKDLIGDVISYRIGMTTIIEIIMLLLRFTCVVIVVGFFFTSQMNGFLKIFNSLSLITIVGAYAYLIKTEAILDKIYWTYNPEKYTSIPKKDDQTDLLEKNILKKFDKIDKFIIPLLNIQIQTGSTLNLIKSMLKNKDN